MICIIKVISVVHSCILVASCGGGGKILSLNHLRLLFKINLLCHINHVNKHLK